jgi:hypothetical protein
MSKAEKLALKLIIPKQVDDIEELCRFFYIKGYKQAEKDLLENKHEKSWRLDEKLWKGIKDIEEASYQYTYDASNDWAYDIPTWEDVQDAFKAGSEWKEEITLTWEDIDWIVGEAVCRVPEDSGKEQICKEVLKRFNKIRNERLV